MSKEMKRCFECHERKHTSKYRKCMRCDNLLNKCHSCVESLGKFTDFYMCDTCVFNFDEESEDDYNYVYNLKDKLNISWLHVSYIADGIIKKQKELMGKKVNTQNKERYAIQFDDLSRKEIEKRHI